MLYKFAFSSKLMYFLTPCNFITYEEGELECHVSLQAEFLSFCGHTDQDGFFTNLSSVLPNLRKSRPLVVARSCLDCLSEIVILQHGQ